MIKLSNFRKVQNRCVWCVRVCVLVSVSLKGVGKGGGKERNWARKGSAGFGKGGKGERGTWEGAGKGGGGDWAGKET